MACPAAERVVVDGVVAQDLLRAVLAGLRLTKRRGDRKKNKKCGSDDREGQGKALWSLVTKQGAWGGAAGKRASGEVARRSSASAEERAERCCQPASHQETSEPGQACQSRCAAGRGGVAARAGARSGWLAGAGRRAARIAVWLLDAASRRVARLLDGSRQACGLAARGSRLARGAAARRQQTGAWLDCWQAGAL